MGVGVGAFEGIEVGIVGVTVGTVVGIGDGGISVGAVVGFGVGNFVGVAVGLRVGSCVVMGGNVGTATIRFASVYPSPIL